LRIRLRWILLGSAGLVVVALFLFPAWWPLIVGRQPTILFPNVSGEEQVALETLQAVNPTHAAAMYVYGTPTMVPEETQARPEMERPIILATGSFNNTTPLYWSHGDVLIFQDGDNLYLRLEDFSTRNGPDLHVLLALNAAPQSIAADTVDLGPLIGSTGSQNYPIDQSFDLSLYTHVLLYSESLGTIFSVASLETFQLEEATNQ
jgi:hypothetical protein